MCIKNKKAKPLENIFTQTHSQNIMSDGIMTDDWLCVKLINQFIK